MIHLMSAIWTDGTPGRGVEARTVLEPPGLEITTFRIANDELSLAQIGIREGINDRHVTLDKTWPIPIILRGRLRHVMLTHPVPCLRRKDLIHAFLHQLWRRVH
jgi:hypothetical protein